MRELVGRTNAAVSRRLRALLEQPRPYHYNEIWYSTIRPESTYSPWYGDEGFLRVEQAIAGHTLVDRYRLYELWQLVGQAPLAGDLLELGVWRGGTGALIATRARQLGLGAEVVLCDTFTGVVKTGDRDPNYRGGEHADASPDDVKQLLTRLDVTAKILIGVFPDQTGEQVADRRFRLCHLDLDAYASTRDAFEWVWPRLVPGGIAVFDDYGFSGTGGVTRFVDEQRAESGRTVVHNLNGHAVIVKT